MVTNTVSVMAKAAYFFNVNFFSKQKNYSPSHPFKSNNLSLL